MSDFLLFLGRFHVLALHLPIGIVLGIWIQRKLSTTWFFRLAYILLFCTGAKLLYDGLMH